MSAPHRRGTARRRHTSCTATTAAAAVLLTAALPSISLAAAPGLAPPSLAAPSFATLPGATPAAAAGTSRTTARPAVDADAVFKRLSATVRSRVAAGYSPAMVAAVVTADGTPPRIVTAGRDAGRPVTPDARFEIGSITKTFTATLLAEMVGRGEVNLSDPVASLLPAGTVVPSLHGRQITLEDLATHRSGLPREATNLFDPGAPSGGVADIAAAYARYDAKRLNAFLATYELPREPGTEAEYSNLGEGLLGYALSVRARKPYEQLLRERVLTPLGLAATGLTSPSSGPGRLVQPHDEDGRPVPAINLGVLAPAGSLRTSLLDLARYAQANLDVLSGTRAGPLADALRLALTPRAELDGPDLRIGLNWLFGMTGAPGLVWHDGTTLGMSSSLTIDPAAGLAVVVLNASRFGGYDVGPHALVPSLPLESFPRERPLSRDALASYRGDYAFPEFTARIVRSGQQLEAFVAGLDSTIFRALGRDRFFSRTGLSIRFTRDRRGVVNAVELTNLDGSKALGTRVGAVRHR